MKNLNKDQQEFEKSWQAVFENAELEPSENAWMKIDNALANQEAKKYKRGLLFYKFAASVAILLLASGAFLSYLYVEDKKLQDYNMVGTELQEQTRAANDEIAEKKEENIDGGNKDVTEQNGAQGKSMPETIAAAGENNGRFDSGDKSGKNSTPGLSGKNLSGATGEGFKREEEKEASQYFAERKGNENDENNFNKRFNESYNSFELLAIKGITPEFSPKPEINVEVFRVPGQFANTGEKSEDYSKYYAGVQFSPNLFNPNINQGSYNASHFDAVLNTNARSYQEEIQPQMSYSYGVNMGMKVSKKWLVNLGFQYAKNNTVATDRVVMAQAQNVPEKYVALSNSQNRLDVSAVTHESTNYRLLGGVNASYNDNMTFASIPVRAGYVILDKKITWILSSGIATDIFLKHEIEGHNGYVDKLTLDTSEHPTFRNLFFNGLASTEVIYHFTKNYSLSLEPSYRMAISSFSKSDSPITSYPRMLGVAAGFRYNF